MKPIVLSLMFLCCFSEAIPVKKEFTFFQALFSGDYIAISSQAVKILVKEEFRQNWISLTPDFNDREYIVAYSNSPSAVTYTTSNGRHFKIDKSTFKKVFGDWITHSTIQGTAGYFKTIVESETRKIFQENLKDKTFYPVLKEGEYVVKRRSEGWIATSMTYETNKGRRIRFSQFCESRDQGFCEN